MPVFNETKQPYEFLVRWDANGNLSGAHIGFRNVVTRDGQPFTETIDPVMPVSMAGGSGFPLADVLSQLQADAIVRGDALQADLAAKNAELKASQDQVTALQADLAAKQAEIDALTQVPAEAE